MLPRCLRRNLLASCLGLALAVAGCRTAASSARAEHGAGGRRPTPGKPGIRDSPPQGNLPPPSVALLIRAWLDTLRPATAAILPRRFTMFQRFHDHVEGTGICLYMAKRMVENARGRIEVHRQLGAGTTFFVCLPHATGPAGRPYPA